MQGDKCLADICRPIAEEGIDGKFDVIRPNATANCCLLTVHTQQDADDKCFLVEVCEGEAGLQVSHLLLSAPLVSFGFLVEALAYIFERCSLTDVVMQQPPPPPQVEEMAPSCSRWKMEAYPVLNDGSDIVVRSADGILVPNGVKDLTIVRL